MTINDNTAIQELNDMQKQIEDLENEWTKAFKSGDQKKADRLDRKIELLLAMRHGMEAMLTSLKIGFNRKDYRTVDLNGDWAVHTVWSLI